MAAPPIQQSVPPAGWYFPPYGARQPFPMQRPRYPIPSGGQRVGVAVASVALLIPLVAIVVDTMTSLLAYVSAATAITAGLISVALVCLTVVAINIAFNFDMFRQPR